MEKRVAVITGGAGGIGAAVVERLSRSHFVPVVIDRDEMPGRQLLRRLGLSEGQGAFFRVDVTKMSEVRSVFEGIRSDFGRINVLVNAVGGTLHTKLMQDFSLAEWREVVDLNLKSTFLCCQAAIPIMKAQKQGSIVNTASNYAITGSTTRTAYSAAKAGIIAFTKSLALEVAPYGVRANVVAPGRTATDRVMGHYDAETWTAKGREIPMGRAAEPLEIAEGVAFLAGDESAYMTGQTLHVNGGMVMP